MFSIIGDAILFIFGLGLLCGILIACFIVKRAYRRAYARVTFWNWPPS